MARAIVTVHLPTHRRQSLEAYGESPRQIGEAYDKHIGDYLVFLGRLARECDFDLRTDRQDLGPVYTIDEMSHDDKKRAHRWLEALPDIWEWITEETPPRQRGWSAQDFPLLR